MPIKLCSGKRGRCAAVAVYRGRCRECNATRERTIDRAGKRIYATKKWANTRRRVLAEQPLCAVKGCDAIADHVDHIVAVEDGGAPWDRANLQGMCAYHHGQKTKRELAARENR